MEYENMQLHKKVLQTIFKINDLWSLMKTMSKTSISVTVIDI
jgi:hypothetical protein